MTARNEVVAAVEGEVGPTTVDVDEANTAIHHASIAVVEPVHLDDVAVYSVTHPNIVIVAIAWVVVVDTAITERKLDRDRNQVVDVLCLASAKRSGNETSAVEIEEGAIVEVEEVVKRWKSIGIGVEVGWSGLKWCVGCWDCT